MEHHPELAAAEITGRLWAAITAAGGIHPPVLEPRHFRCVFRPTWLAGLPLPIAEDRPPGRPVTLLDDSQEFDRFSDSNVLWNAYVTRPRAMAYEDINRGMGSTWHALAAHHLGRLTSSGQEVGCSVFQSSYGDQGLGAHADAWYAAIIHLRGRKTWQAGETLLDGTGSPTHQFTVNPGDVLLIPKDVPHTSTTPPEPGFSLHLTFAIDREPLPTTLPQGA